MIQRTERDVTFTCDVPGCGETQTVHPVPKDGESKWLLDNDWEKGRFLFCPCCVEARNQLRKAA